MNSLWPAATRISCLTRRTIFETSGRVDSLAARLTQRTCRKYSISAVPSRRRDAKGLGLRAFGRIQLTSRTWIGIRAFATARIVTQFQELPGDYRDEVGLSFRSHPLSKEESKAVFGKGMNVETANRLLSVIHGRRVAGTLEDPNVINSTPEYERRAIKSGLAWLRENVPIDEVACAGLRAEQELAAMEADILQDAERLGIYKPNLGSSTTKAAKKGGKASVYGESGLDKIRKAKEKALDDKEALKTKMSQADEIRQNTGPLEKIGSSNVVLRRPGENPRLKYYLERAKVLPNEVPEMSIFARLWPSGLVVLGTVIACWIFTQVYTPPNRSSRIWPDLPPSAATIISLIIANSLILFAWRIPPMFRLLNKYFITVPGYTFPLSLVGNIFSHQSVSHFSINMLVLWFVGTRLHEEVGRGNFLAIYLASGALGSFASLASFVLRNNFLTSSLGASGALSGIIGCYLWLNGSDKVTLFGVFPPDNWPQLSAVLFLAVLIGMDFLGLAKKTKIIKVDHWAHLGGYFSGIGAAEILKARKRQRELVEAERRKNMGLMERIREGRL